MSSFSAMNTGIRGLNAAQRAMDVIGKNIVNANTPGYTRQVTHLASEGTASSAATLHSGNDVVFGGVHVSSISRVRDAFLEASRTTASATHQNLESRYSALSGVESILGEPTDSGLQTTLNDFFSSWHDLAARPEDSGVGGVVIERGRAVATQLSLLGNAVSARWDIAKNNLESTVAQVNSVAGSLAELNSQIRERAGEAVMPNDLLDQRDVMMRELGDLIGAKAVVSPDGSVGAQVNGVTLVNGSHAIELSVEGAPALSQATTDPLRITWGGGHTLNAIDGQASALLTVTQSDIPDIAAAMDGIAVSLRDGVNALHTAGFALDGTAGGDFFAGDSAINLSVAVSDSTELAVASEVNTIDGSNAMAIGDLVDDRLNPTGGTGPVEQWRELVTGLGVKVQSIERNLEVQNTVLNSADNAVESDAGVNLDEEMSQLLLFQRMYQASARVVTVTDEMLDTLINRTGLVGR